MSLAAATISRPISSTLKMSNIAQLNSQFTVSSSPETSDLVCLSVWVDGHTLRLEVLIEQ